MTSAAVCQGPAARASMDKKTPKKNRHSESAGGGWWGCWGLGAVGDRRARLRRQKPHPRPEGCLGCQGCFVLEVRCALGIRSPFGLGALGDVPCPRGGPDGPESVCTPSTTHPMFVGCHCFVRTSGLGRGPWLFVLLGRTRPHRDCVCVSHCALAFELRLGVHYLGRPGADLVLGVQVVVGVFGRGVTAARAPLVTKVRVGGGGDWVNGS